MLPCRVAASRQAGPCGAKHARIRSQATAGGAGSTGAAEPRRGASLRRWTAVQGRGHSGGPRAPRRRAARRQASAWLQALYSSGGWRGRHGRGNIPLPVRLYSPGSEPQTETELWELEEIEAYGAR